MQNNEINNEFVDTPESDDLAPQYLNYKTDAEKSAKIDAFMSRTAAPEEDKQAKIDAFMKGSEPEGQEAKPQDEERGFLGKVFDTTVGGISSITKPGRAVVSKVGPVAKDVGRGAVEIPRAVAGGVLDAAQATVDITQEIDDWVQDKIPVGGWQITNPETGEIDIDWLNSEEFKKLRETQKSINLPDIADPKSNTGKMIEGASQFLAGFIGAGKVNWIKDLAKKGTKGKVASVTTKGMLADATVFDPHEERMANFLQQFPAFQGAFTDFLAADENDSAAMGRFKNSVEGLGLGFLAEGLSIALRAMRKASNAKIEIQRAQEAASPTQVEEAIQEFNFSSLGDPKSKELISRPKPKKELSEGELQKDIEINWARIDAPEDVKSVMEAMAFKSKGDINKARGGVQTFEDVKLDADQVNAWEVLTERRQGQPLGAAEGLAARNLWVSSSNKLTDLSAEAARNPSDENLFAVRKMIAVHNTIQKEVLGARADTSRALNAWRISAKEGGEQARAISEMLEQTGGRETTQELAKRIAALSQTGMAKELDKFIEKSAFAKTREAVAEGWIMSLLWGPKTHIVNAMSNTAVLGLRMFERGVAANMAKALGDEGSVAAGEATTQMFGVIQAQKDALRFAVKSFKTRESGFGMNKIELPRDQAISSEAFKIGKETPMGRFVDFVGAGVGLPGRGLTAADEYFKTIGYRMELNAQALRTARDEVLSGKIDESAMKDRINEIIENPPENIRLASIDAATYQTFTDAPGEVGKLLSKVRNKVPVLGIYTLPFSRTPARIMAFAFERTPLAPLMSSYRANIAAGGARRDLALAQMATGSAIMAISADLTMNKLVSGKGPSDPAERQALRRTGWQPYSFKFNGVWHSYQRGDPLGTLLGLSADLVEMMDNVEPDSDASQELEKASIALAAAIGNNVMSKSYLTGVSDFIEAISAPDRKAESYAQRAASSFIPFTSLSGEARRFKDPYMREVNTIMEAIRNKIPGLSEGLPKNRDLWGRPKSYRSPYGKTYDLLSPIYASAEDPEPIDQEILSGGKFSTSNQTGEDIQDDGGDAFNISRPSKKVSFDGASVDMDKYPGAYSRYLELAGNELKHPAWRMGAKDLLNAVVQGKHPLSAVYNIKSDGPDGGKELFIRSTISSYREMARRQILEEYPEIAENVGQKKEKARKMKMPVLRNN